MASWLLASAGSVVMGSLRMPGGRALSRWPYREEGRQESVSMSRASCMSSAGMDSSRARNFWNLDNMGLRACVWDPWVMMGMPARIMWVFVMDVPFGNRCMSV